jgi:peptidoglycan/xylan/chitin deacetylase (PgdA/CDA1 family)
MQVALKVDVDTYRGTREGVPRLVELLKKHGADATFLFSLGPDHTGRAIRRVFRPGFVQKVSRTSVVEHYGWRTLMYGTLLPGPDIGVKCADILRGVRDAEFEVGVHTWDHVKWQDNVVDADEAWTAREMQHAVDRFTKIFGEPPRVHGAAGWQMNRAAVRLTQRLGFGYASDTRGTTPFLPVWDGEVTLCPQLPTTLPTLDELIGLDGCTEDNVADRVLALTAGSPRPLEVYTLHAEMEGMRLAPAFERLLAGWRDQGAELTSLAGAFTRLETRRLPHHRVVLGTVPGRSGTLAVQGPEFLPDHVDAVGPRRAPTTAAGATVPAR